LIAALRAGVIGGAMSGAVFGGVGGRIVMRIVALIDQSAYGVRTDSGATVGEITAGGTITLTIVTMLAGISVACCTSPSAGGCPGPA
jgi:hypothetical protein